MLGKMAACAVLWTAALAAQAQQGQTVKIAYIDPMSGPAAAQGMAQLKGFQFLAEQFSKKNDAGVKFELIAIDNKLSPQETTVAVRSAIDQGARYIVQGNGSAPALAIINAIDKFNERNPGHEVVFFNYGATDPDLTQGKCSFWHFRVESDGAQRVQVLTDYIKERPEIKKVYLINQNYSTGLQFQKTARELIARKRPDIQIVGDDLIPLAQVRDFAPYVAKVKQSGADSVVTSNWGPDFFLLMKASVEAGLKVNYYGYYAATTGTPSALGTSTADRVYSLFYAHYNMDGPLKPLMFEFQKRYDDDIFSFSTYTVYDMLVRGFVAAKSTEPAKVARVLEGMKFKAFNGEVEMRRADHQILQPLYMLRWEKASEKYPYSPEHTGMTLVPVREFPASASVTPTVCEMKRPAN
jgi:branched-chain amino acid transport system substrate-binding protein